MEEYIYLYSDIIAEFSKYQIVFIGDANKILILSQFIDSSKTHILRDFDGNISGYWDYIIVLDSTDFLENILEHAEIIRILYIKMI